MFRRTIRTAASAVTWMALAMFALWCAPGVAGDSGPGERAQQIYLDPETGEIVPPDRPTVGQPGKRRIGRPGIDAQDNGRRSGDQADTGRGPRARESDGVQMLTPDPDDAPMQRAVRCPDGSLRIGHAEAKGETVAGQSGRDALCAPDRN